MSAPPPDSDARTIARRASSFGGQAAAYAAERPGYPDAAVRWALRPVAARTPLRVLDLAAGTGKLTEGLLRHTADVVAVEPDSGMLAELQARLPGVPALTGTAERIPLTDGSVDAVLVGQAMHWFDLSRALPEMARVLAPGGVLAGLWNIDDHRIPWVRRLKEVSRNTVSFKDWNAESAFTPTPEFPAIEQVEFSHAQRRTAESMAATIATHSHVLILPEAERTALITRIVDYLRATPETASGEFELPIVTVAIRSLLGSRSAPEDT
ncbi:class I SAM-dependent methyltransferase [Actinoallomurus purpureus]|uniref:class I SAM-dependent methyltransferase n=1 Tax=Actinoallomurus purpureus TaxID=478114 RepID=UPI002091EF80|nr:class I SAM-dependent methyltransferase [Actinoallomurus purpureus]MCO6008722.1 class I SAM-dependent methyltransferase [Actinoallomurus purpureus]